MGNSASSQKYDNLIIDPGTVIMSTERIRVILESDGNRLIARSVISGSELHQQPQSHRPSRSQQRQERVILVQEGNRLIVRRVNGSHERNEPNINDSPVPSSVLLDSIDGDDPRNPCDYSLEKLSIMYSMQTLSEVERDDLNNDCESCTICFEDYTSKSDAVLKLPCGHIYHGTCICQWISRAHRSCPTCRETLLKL